MAVSSNNVPPPTGRLISHFANRDRQAQSTGWSDLWESNESDLWDRGKPSPALADLLGSRPDLVGAASHMKEGSSRRPKALVPGCGKGYEVVMLALHGYDAYGLEVSPAAVQTAQAYAEVEMAEPSALNFADEDASKRDSSVMMGNVKFVYGDYFAREWERECRSNEEVEEQEEGFDLIYDYTFLCALLPEMRKDWARRMRELLRPNGVLVCLEFPLYKDRKLPGPPWGLAGVHWNLLAQGGDGILAEGTATTEENGEEASGSFERLAYIKPTRTYKVGEGTDMLSIWGWEVQVSGIPSEFDGAH